MKLLYLAERLSLKKFGESITSDSFVAMKYGPALWETYQCMTDGGSVKNDGWSSWIRDEAERHLSGGAGTGRPLSGRPAGNVGG